MKTVAWIWFVVLIAGCAWLSARADVDVAPDMHGTYDDCIKKFTDVGLRDEVDQLDKNHKFIVKVQRSSGTITKADDPSKARNGTGSDSTISWNPNSTGNLTGEKVKENPCATLYHEMYHAIEQFKGTMKDYADCVVTLPGGKKERIRLSISEVNASRAENRFRRAEKLDERGKYNGVDLPGEGLECDPAPPPKSSGGCNISSGGPGGKGAKTAPCDTPEDLKTVPACLVGTWNVSHPWSDAHSHIQMSGVYQITIRADGSFDEKRDMRGTDPRNGGSTSFSHTSYGDIVLKQDEKVPRRYRISRGTHIGRPGATAVIIDNKGRQVDNSATEQMVANAPWPNGMYFDCQRADADNPTVDGFVMDANGHQQEWSHFVYSRARH